MVVRYGRIGGAIDLTVVHHPQFRWVRADKKSMDVEL